jgi:hypothetical protein
MAAAYPFIDDFVAAGTIASLERLGELLAGMRAPGRSDGLAFGGRAGGVPGGPRVWRARRARVPLSALPAEGASVAGSVAPPSTVPGPSTNPGAARPLS